MGLGMFAFVLHGRPEGFDRPDALQGPGDLYYVWRDYGPHSDLERGSLGGPDIVELQKGERGDRRRRGLQPMLGGIFSLREGAEPMEMR